MRKTKIVADTSCDLLSLKHVAFACAPMKIIQVKENLWTMRVLT